MSKLLFGVLFFFPLFVDPSSFHPLIIPPAAHISHLLLASFCSSMPSTLDQEAQLSSPGGYNAVVAMATWWHRGVVLKYRRLLWISVANVCFFFLNLPGPCQTSRPPQPQLNLVLLDLVCHTPSSRLVTFASFLKDLSPQSSRRAVRAPLSIDSDANVRQCLDEESSPPSTIACVILVTIASIVLVTPVWINRVCLIWDCRVWQWHGTKSRQHAVKIVVAACMYECLYATTM